MTKKDYIKLAKELKSHRDFMNEWAECGMGSIQVPITHFIDGLCDILQEDNPRFNQKRFIAACQ